jgi:hypothetical protein
MVIGNTTNKKYKSPFIKNLLFIRCVAGRNLMDVGSTKVVGKGELTKPWTKILYLSEPHLPRFHLLFSLASNPNYSVVQPTICHVGYTVQIKVFNQQFSSVR